MALLKPAFEKLMILEGAYVVDHAGPTNWGVTLPVLKLLGDVDDDGVPDGDLNRDGIVDATDVLIMEQDTAYKVVDTMWWTPYRYGWCKAQAVANKILDMSFNMGPKQAHILVQQSCNCTAILKEHGLPQLLVDGWLGPISYGAINAISECVLLPLLRSSQETFYRVLVSHNPDKYGKYLQGWINRARS